jgi:hypothetical protein
MHRRGFSLVKNIVALFVIIALMSMCLHTIMAWVPRNLQSVAGFGASSTAEDLPDLRERLKDAIKNSYEVTISEEELNRYVASRLKLTQSPIVDNYIKITGVFFDLKPNIIDVSIEREFDMPNNIKADGSKKFDLVPFSQTVSMQIELETSFDKQNNRLRTINFLGGHFGKSPAPGQLIKVVKPSFDIIAQFFEKEIKLGYKDMDSVIIGDGMITFNSVIATE